MVKRKTKTVVEEQEKQPRAKTKADEIYNARRHARRALEKAQKRVNAGTEAGQKYIANLQQVIKASYAETKGAKRGQYKFDKEKLKETLTTVARVATQTEVRERNKRKNIIFKEEINKTRRGAESRFGKEEVNIFYTATREYWEGRPPGKRNEAILRGLKVDTLEEAWNIIFEDENVKEALKRARRAQKQTETEEDIADGSLEPPDEAGSPPYIKYLINVISR